MELGSVSLALLGAYSGVQRSKATTPLDWPDGRAGTYPVPGRSGIVQSP
jgi:hypothetical protein